MKKKKRLNIIAGLMLLTMLLGILFTSKDGTLARIMLETAGCVGFFGVLDLVANKAFSCQ